MSKQKKNRKPVLGLEDNFLVRAIRRFFLLGSAFSTVWLLGYFRFSPTWVWAGLVVYVWREHHRWRRQQKLEIGYSSSVDEKKVVLAAIDQLPSWVNFPDVERVEWVNKIARQLWPYVSEYVERVMREKVEPSVRASLPSPLQSFKFSTIDLGDVPPRIGGVKVYSQLKRDEIYMDVEIIYCSDCDIAVSIRGINAGIKDFSLYGTLRVVFKPLLSKPPIIGGIKMFFLSNPEIDFELTNLASALDLPGLGDMLNTIIHENISSRLVLPNCVAIKIAKGVNINKLRYPQPQGVIRVTVVEAKELIAADFSLTGKGSSDPYVILKLGSKECRTRIIPKNLEPEWNETFEMVVDSADGQLLYIDVFDDDQGTKDDELGRTQVDLSQLNKDGFADEWLPLEDVRSGMIHIQLTWLWLANDPMELDQVILESFQDGTVEENTTHIAMLLVYLDSAMHLPNQIGKKTTQQPSAQARLSVGQQTLESKVKVNTSEPRWEESFRFMLHNVHQQNLDLEIKDSKSKKSIGCTSVKIKDLLVEEDMAMDKKFHVKTLNPDTYIQMRLALRILTPRADSSWTEEEDELVETVEFSDVNTESDPITNYNMTTRDKQNYLSTKDSPFDNESERHDEDSVDGPSGRKRLSNIGRGQTVYEETGCNSDDKNDDESGEDDDTSAARKLVRQSSTTRRISGDKNKVLEEEVVTNTQDHQTQAQPFSYVAENHRTESTSETEKVKAKVVDGVNQSGEESDDSGEERLEEIVDMQEHGTISPVSDFNPKADAEALSKAMKLFGIDEDAVINILSRRSQEQRYQIAQAYRVKTQKDLSKDLSSKLKGNLKNLCIEMIMEPAEFDAKQLYKAMKGLGSDEQVLVEIICTRSNARLERIKDAYQKLYNRGLVEAVADDTSGDFRQLLLGCLKATRSEEWRVDRKQARRDARALKECGEKLSVTRESDLYNMIVSRSYAQLRAIFNEYEAQTNDSIEEHIKAGTSGDLRDGLLTIVQMVSNKEKYFAETLYKSMKGLGTDDDTLVRVVASRCEVDMVQIKQEFESQFKQSLATVITDDTSGDYRKMLLAMLGERPDCARRK